MPEAFATNFGGIDWAIVALYLIGIFAVGVWANRYIHTAAGYIVGGRAAGTPLNIATYIGTGLGLVTLMYASIDAFSHGFAYVTLALIGAAVGLTLGSTGWVIRRLRAMELMTIPEFFERRFDRRTRVLAGVLCAAAGILNMGLFPKMGATFITTVAGLGIGEDDAEAMVNLVTSVLVVMALVYTVLGGMVSVIVTDYLQYVLLTVGMGVGVWFCLTDGDLGWTRITQTLAEHRGERMFNPVAEGGYGWWWIAFNAVTFFAAGIAWAPEASRALTAGSERGAMRTFLLASPGQFVRLAVPALWAAAAFTLIVQSPTLSAHFFPDGTAREARHAAQAMPLVLGQLLPSGLLGLLAAGLMAAFMSTHDSYFLCWSSVICRDVVNPLRRRPLSDRGQVRLTRIVIVAIGAFVLVWGIWYDLPASVWTYMAVTGSIYLSGASVALVGGMYWKRASRAGATAALLGGLIAVAGIFTDPIERWTGIGLSGPAVGLTSFAFCIVLMVVFSLWIPDDPTHPGASAAEPASPASFREGGVA